MENKKLLNATHEGKLKIGEVELNVAVLEDGTRVITQSAVFKAFGRTKSEPVCLLCHEKQAAGCGNDHQ